MNRQSRYRWLGMIGLLVWCCVSGCGGPQGLHLQFLDAETLKKVQFLDLALFSTSVKCEELNQSNYRSSEKKFSDARLTNADRGVDIVSVKLEGVALSTGEDGASGYNIFADRLGGDELKNAGADGLDVQLYVLALGSVGDSKVSLAQGCATVKLHYQKTVNASIVLTTIK